MTETAVIDFGAVKAKQQATWATGDYAVIGTTLQLTGETLCESVDVSAGERVVDVAAGNGNAALAAARRGAEVTASDYVPTLLDGAKARAAAERVAMEFETADAEALPWADGTFDVALSTFGVMFTPDHAQSAAELIRVCRPGGRIGVTAWTPDGFIGRMFKIVGSYVAPPPGVASPLLWGTDEHVQGLFGAGASVQTERHAFQFRYRSARHWLDTFVTYYGPTNKAFAALDDNARASLDAELIALAEENNVAGNGSLRVASDYLQTVAIRTS
ncbi:MAG TPA: class I SAM-dependent methyltransferase [Jatrophihabitans sp.]|nr:class I SAM-dependent methyltransferase [Jatrophihabitans sp.]